MTDEEKNIKSNGNIELKQKTGVAWWQPAIMLFLKFSGWVFVPVIGALFLGKWLDKKFGSEPIIFLSLIGFAFLVSMFGIIKGTSQEYKKIEDEEKKRKLGN